MWKTRPIPCPWKASTTENPRAWAYLSMARPISITLLPGETLDGIILDSDGAPVEGAEVLVTEASPMSGLLIGMPMGESGNADAVADPNGWFAVADLATETRYTVSASRPGFVTAQVNGVTLPRTEPVELILEPSSRLAGIVLDPAGEPIAGAGVNMLRTRSVEAGGIFCSSGA